MASPSRDLPDTSQSPPHHADAHNAPKAPTPTATQIAPSVAHHRPENTTRHRPPPAPASAPMFPLPNPHSIGNRDIPSPLHFSANIIANYGTPPQSLRPESYPLVRA